ncbi:MAG: hypothetical protein ACI8X5_004133 [Planctomycetota bacterium]|jgi:uncharacterized protein (DUF1330 family)
MSKIGSRLISALSAVFTILMLGLLWLYAFSQSPLSAEEVDRYIERIEAHAHKPGGRHDMAELRRFLDSDDGRAFYTVNLYEFNDRAQYFDDQPHQESGREAFGRFSKVMLRLLAKRASHPILGSDWADIASSGWDRIVVVRYRSRRDIAEIFASPEFSEASAHKWAALKRNDRMLVRGLHIPELHVPLAVLALAGGAFAACLLLAESSSGRRHRVG